MRKVNKNLKNIPNILKSQIVEDAFNKNIKNKEYVDTNNRYKDVKNKTIRKQLNKIYNNKCAYCERSFNDIDIHIEHYRPKKGGYYWLSYSWDNLLLACAECNRPKGNKFEINGLKVDYNNEKFEDIHELGNTYDKIENPKIINPEKKDIFKFLEYDYNAKIKSSNNNVNYTINACKLNREGLIKNRVKYLDDFINMIQEHFHLNKGKDIDSFIPVVNRIIKFNEKSEYYCFRKYIVENIDKFLINENKTLSIIIKELFKKLN